MNLPADLLYTKNHEWLRVEGNTATVGITEFAAEALGDVVYVDLPEAGSAVTAGEPCGEIESTKSVTDLYAPTGGEVLGANDAVVQDPSLINSDPLGTGWLLRLRVASSDELLHAAEYAKLVEQG